MKLLVVWKVVGVSKSIIVHDETSQTRELFEIVDRAIGFRSKPIGSYTSSL